MVLSLEREDAVANPASNQTTGIAESVAQRVFELATVIAARTHPDFAPPRREIEQAIDLVELRERGRIEDGSTVVSVSTIRGQEVVNIFDKKRGNATIVFPFGSPRQYSFSTGMREGPISGIDAHLGSNVPCARNTLKVYPRRGRPNA